LAIVASWIKSESECQLWCGTRVAYPIDVAALPESLGYAASEAWTATSRGRVVGFGQLVLKAMGRLHLARLITAPDRRGKGLGRLITVHLLETALTRKPSAVSLNVFAENRPALALYRSLGFAPATRPPDEPASGSVYMEHAA
jgi:ribosomal protein S18 acetylase RimI-like enzyme